MTNCARVPGFIMGGFRDMNHMIAVKKTKSLDLNSVCVCLLLMCERGSCFCSTMLTLSQSKVCASFSYYYPAVAWPPSPAAPPHRSTRHRRAISCLIPWFTFCSCELYFWVNAVFFEPYASLKTNSEHTWDSHLFSSYHVWHIPHLPNFL